MGMLGAISVCTVLYLFQPPATVTQTPLGKPGEPAPVVTPAQPVASPAPAPAPPAPVQPTPPAPPPAPAAASTASQGSGGRVAAFWVILPE